ncbi:MAG: AtpZ/AtpI family protein [Defluviitaleaceae bacterium]|nr:AtpZ/AtpI family protein [Defluviitaleaceae bacterium]
MPKLSKEERKRIFRAAALMTQLAVGTITCVAVSILIGMLLDGWLGTSPVFILIFVFLGIAAAFKYMYDTAKRVGS